MKLRLILGDQLNYSHSWFSKVENDILYVMMEIKQETSYVHHHIQKVVGFFLAMRNFSEYLKKKGYKIVYIKIDDQNNNQKFIENLINIIKQEKIDQFEYLEPDEYRLDYLFKRFTKSLSIPARMLSSEHFLTDRLELKQFFKGKRRQKMEPFYQYMRKKYKILIDSNQKPEGGKWNFDKFNRKKLSKNTIVPPPFLFHHNVEDILKTINKMKIDTFGKIDPKAFIWPINREESLILQDYFLKKFLVFFGTFQDSMSEKYWSIFHSRLSFSLNTKMLNPLEVIKKAINVYQKNQENITISQIEGFVRQILGWREYMRGNYWSQMPNYSKMNFFNNERGVPSWFWTGNTKMNCVKKAINQSLNFAYAHHIQRLMIIGNFALLADLNPNEVDKWYLGVYIDAIEWVEITNTRGMSQYADGGIVGSKPYVASANYINKMSDYCKDCYYNKNEKIGKKSCPFNSLFWRFYHKNQKIIKNPRTNMIYSLWNKTEEENKKAILKTAEYYLVNIEKI